MGKSIWAAIMLMLAATVGASAQSTVSNTNGDTWNLERCISYAKDNNLQIKARNISVEQSRNNLQQSKLDLIPSLSGGSSLSMSWGRSVNLQTLEIIKNKRSMSVSGSLSSSATIFSGFSKLNNIKSNKVALNIAEKQVEKMENDITIQILQAYLQLLLAQEIEKSAQESCKSMEEQVERTAKLVDAGSQAYSTLLEVKAQLANEKSQLVVARNDVRSSKLTLMQLLDLPANMREGFAIAEPNTLSDIMPIAEEYYGTGYNNSIEQIYKEALELPQIKSAELALEKSKYDYRSIYGRLFPSISVQAGYGSYYTDGQSGAFFTQFENNKNPSLGFSLSIPIFNGFNTRTSVRNARLNMESTRIELQMQKEALYKEIQSAYNGAIGAYEKMKAAEENMKSIQESFTYTENKFNVGMMNATDYNIAKANLFKAVSAFYQAKYQYLFELKILDFYKGKQIIL